MNHYAKLGLSTTKLTLSLTMSAALVACFGGGGGDTAPVSATVIPVDGAGNSPFIKVKMRATCANGANAEGIIGDVTPGKGSISIITVCTAPILLEATSTGKMRPIGAPGDGSGDVNYDPAVNLPISNILPTAPAAGASVTANPVTTIVANNAVPSGTSLSAVTPASISTAKTNVETSLGLAKGDADKDSRTPAVAEAATRIVAVVALAAAETATSGNVPAAVTASNSLGKVIAQQIASVTKTGAADSLKTAAKVATAINTGASAINVTTNPAVAAGGRVDHDALAVENMVVAAVNRAVTTGGLTSVDAMNTAIAADTSATTTALKKEHAAETSKAAVSNEVVKMVASIDAAVAANTGPTISATEKETKKEVVKAAAAKIIADANVVINQVAAGTNTSVKASDIAVQVQAVAAGVTTAIENDLKAAPAAKVFATTAQVGTENTAVALVGNLQGTTSKLTSTSTQAVIDASVASSASTALNVVKAVATLSAPVATGDAAADTANKAAFKASISAVASVATSTFDPTTQTENFKATVNTIKTQLVTAIGSSATTSGNNALDVATIATQVAIKAIEATVAAGGTGGVVFTAPVVVAPIDRVVVPVVPVLPPLEHQTPIPVVTGAAG